MYSITKNGQPLDKSLYTIDEKTKTFSSNEHGLVLDFSGEFGWTFKTGYDCTFKTGSGCTFDTGYDCTFNTGSGCTFDTGYDCVIVRRDIYELIELDGTKKIKLNSFGVKGYTLINEEQELAVETIQIGNQKYNKKEVEEALKNVKSI